MLFLRIFFASLLLFTASCTRYSSQTASLSPKEQLEQEIKHYSLLSRLKYEEAQRVQFRAWPLYTQAMREHERYEQKVAQLKAKLSEQP